MAETLRMPLMRTPLKSIWQPNATLVRIESLCAASTPSTSKLGSASA
jgi:hypothetical protein